MRLKNYIRMRNNQLNGENYKINEVRKIPFPLLYAFCKKCGKYKRIKYVRLSILEDFWKFELICEHKFTIKMKEKIEWE